MQNAKKRETCYEMRDTYHQCLDTLPDDPEEACAKQLKAFTDACPKSWVSYFEKQREPHVKSEPSLPTVSVSSATMNNNESRYVMDVVMKNFHTVSQIRTMGAILAGICAGILGLTNLAGVIFFLACSAAVSAAIYYIGCNTDAPRYFPKGTSDLFSFGSLFTGAMTFVLVWTVAYDAVYIF